MYNFTFLFLHFVVTPRVQWTLIRPRNLVAMVRIPEMAYPVGQPDHPLRLMLTLIQIMWRNVARFEQH